MNAKELIKLMVRVTEKTVSTATEYQKPYLIGSPELIKAWRKMFGEGVDYIETEVLKTDTEKAEGK